MVCVYGSIAGVHSSTFDWSLHDMRKVYLYMEQREGERMNLQRDLSTGLKNKIQGYLKVLLKGEETGKFHQQRGCT